MRAISKGPEPASLTTHRRRPHSDYDNYREKSELRHALVTEQRGLCCYCMGRIRSDPTYMKIEHWQCQAHYRPRELDYRNLLASCQGRVSGPGGGPPHQHHCDAKKANRDLQWNPADPDHRIETRIRYELDGAIRSEGDFDDQLDTVLNLNLQVLRNNRAGVLTAVLEWWKREKARVGGRVPRNRLLRERDKRIGGSGFLTPYCQVAVWWLNQKLDRMAA